MEMLMVGEKQTSVAFTNANFIPVSRCIYLELQTSVSFNAKDLMMGLRRSGSTAAAQGHLWNVQSNFICFLKERHC